MPGMNAHEPSVGIIGLGYGRAHIPAFQADGCRVVAVCQRDEDTANAVAGSYSVPRVFSSWEDILDRARPEIVVIATPPHLHHAIALRAFAAGAHVRCEKPLAMTRAEAQSMVDAAARAGRIGPRVCSGASSISPRAGSARAGPTRPPRPPGGKTGLRPGERPGQPARLLAARDVGRRGRVTSYQIR